MSGENQYINPIIETLFKTYQGQQNAEQLKQQREQFQAENKHKEAVLAQQESEFQRRHDLELRTLKEFHLPQLELAMKGQHLKEMGSLFDASAQGVGPSGLASLVGGSVQPPVNLIPGGGVNGPGVTIPGGINLPSGGSISQQDLPNPTTNAAQEAERMRQIINAQMGAKEPYEVAAEGRSLAGKKSLLEQENEFKSGLEDKNTLSREKIAKLERDSQMMIAQGHNATALQVAHINKDISPDQMQAGIIAGLTGQRAFNSDNIYDRAVMSGIQQAGGRVFDKKDAQALQSMQGLNPVFDKLEKFANDNLRSSKLGAMAQGAGQKLANDVGFPTDKQTQLDEIKSQALKIGRELEGLTGGRMNAKQLELDLNSIGGAGQTKEQALDRLKNLRDVYVNREQNQILGGLPEPQKKLISSTYGIKLKGEQPEWLKVAPKSNSNGKKLDEDKSIEIGHPVYK